MKLWLLQQVRGLNKDGFPMGYDYPQRAVVRAESEAEARRLASEEDIRYHTSVLNDPDLFSCSELSADGDAGVICLDVLEG